MAGRAEQKCTVSKVAMGNPISDLPIGLNGGSRQSNGEQAIMAAAQDERFPGPELQSFSGLKDPNLFTKSAVSNMTRLCAMRSFSPLMHLSRNSS
jgi:hypothetical protein